MIEISDHQLPKKRSKKWYTKNGERVINFFSFLLFVPLRHKYQEIDNLSI